jgi:geranylgeranyl pyrophosphate synthase
MNSEIKNVEKRLQKAIESNDPILREASSHLLSNATATRYVSSVFFCGPN